MAEGDFDLDGIRVYLSLERFGEVVAATALKLSDLLGVEPPDLKGEQMRELVVYAFDYVCHMADRSAFEASVKSDLAQLGTAQGTPFS